MANSRTTDAPATPVAAPKTSAEERKEAFDRAGVSSETNPLSGFTKEVDQMARRIAEQGLKGADPEVSAALVTELAGIRDRANEALNPKPASDEDEGDEAKAASRKASK